MKDSNPPTGKPSPIAPSRMHEIQYWLPSIEAGAVFAVTLRYLPFNHREEILEDSEEVSTDYLYYLSLAPAIAVGGFFGVTLLCNALFGRKPSTEQHYNPLSDRIIQGADLVIPVAVAGINSVLNFVGKTFGGSRADAAVHAVSEGTAVALMAHHVFAIENDLENHRLDRCPSTPPDGYTRRLESIAAHAEELIVHGVQVISSLGFWGMNLGMTRFSINDDNRLYVLNGVLLVERNIADFFVAMVNDDFYYAEMILDTYPVSLVLRAAGIADPAHPVQLVDMNKPSIQKKIAKEIGEAGEAVAKAADIVEERLEEIGHSISHGFEVIGDGVMGVLGHRPHREEDTRKPTVAEQADASAEGAEQSEGGIMGAISSLFGEGASLVTSTELGDGSHALVFHRQGEGEVHLNLPAGLPSGLILHVPGNLQNHLMIELQGGVRFELYVGTHEQLHPHRGMVEIFTPGHRHEYIGNGINSYRLGDGETRIVFGGFALDVHGRIPDPSHDHH